MRNEIDLTNKRIVISRTDSIGDVMLTLPICAWLKQQFKGIQIIFLANNYTQPVVDCYSHVDEFIDWKALENSPSLEQIDRFRKLNADAIIHVFPNKKIASLAKKAKIKNRIGTSHRPFHLLTCNYRPNFTRKKSPLHEAQLNFELLKPFGLRALPTLEAINNLTSFFKAPENSLPDFIEKALNSSDKTVILHPKSQGSAMEWGIENYKNLALALVEKGFTVFFTGTEKEGLLFRDDISFSDKIIDTTGKLTLSELITFIGKCENLVACSTGPLHIAGYLNRRAIGLFSPRKPIHPGRWKALGKDVRILVDNEECPTCASGKVCRCIEHISVEKVLNEIR
jgi:heptosyltransferase III